MFPVSQVNAEPRSITDSQILSVSNRIELVIGYIVKKIAVPKLKPHLIKCI
jgi:hypothetical protein